MTLSLMTPTTMTYNIMMLCIIMSSKVTLLNGPLFNYNKHNGIQHNDAKYMTLTLITFGLMMISIDTMLYDSHHNDA